MRVASVGEIVKDNGDTYDVQVDDMPLLLNIEAAGDPNSTLNYQVGDTVVVLYIDGDINNGIIVAQL